MTFRRLIISGDAVDRYKSETEKYIKGVYFKTNYPDVDIKIIKSPFKENTLVIDIKGEGADSVAKKLRDQGTKYKLSGVIKNKKSYEKI